MKLKNLLPEAFTQIANPSSESSLTFNVDDTLEEFKDNVANHTRKEKANSEKALNDKLKGKTVTFRGSKGYKQAQKDYTIVVKNVNIQWHYEDYFVVVKDKKNDEYFTIDGFPINIHNDSNAPVTALTQNTSKNHPESINKVKQF